LREAFYQIFGLADVEAEELDLGGVEQEDLSLGDEMGDHDPDALDSDSDDDGLNEELGIGDRGSDGECFRGYCPLPQADKV
jgi:ATP-dependent RNA helicase DHX37/DHR1